MLTAAILLAVGIAAASWRMPPVWICIAGVAAGCVTAALCLRTHRTAATAALAAALVFLGAVLAGVRLRSDMLPDDYAVYEIELGSDAVLRPDTRSRQGDARIVARRGGNGEWHGVRGRVRIYADSALQLAEGQRIVCRGRIAPFGGDSGYEAMMRRKGYAGRLYLSSGNILQINDREPSALLRSMHRRAVDRISGLPLRPGNRAVALAVGTGESTMLGRSQRAGYSRAGTAHLLALSGLHVGIVYLLINLLLRWLPLLTHGHIIRSAAAVILLWAYVFSTGMPPSAVRAALMFSMLQIARAASADYSPLNALACAAFASLCFDPGLLYDAGFRLSYISVAAIILCAVPLCRRLHISREHIGNHAAKALIPVANFIIDTLAVGFVATLATAPLVSHLFGVIPLAGIVAAPAAIAAAAATVALTAVWIALPSGFAAQAFGRAIDLTAGAMNAISEWIAARPAAALDIRLSGGETVACYAVATLLLCALAALANRKSTTDNKHIR